MKPPTNPQPVSSNSSDIESVIQKVFIDYYNQKEAWPELPNDLFEFYQEHSDEYPSNACKIVQSLEFRPLKNGHLYIVSIMDIKECEFAIQLFAKFIYPNNFPNRPRRLIMVLSPSGHFIEGPVLDFADPNQVAQAIVEPISVKTYS